MASPGTPSNMFVQQANGVVLVSWDIVAGASSYPVYRSTDGVAYTLLATSAVNSYLDSAVTVGTQYYYQVGASNGTVSALTQAQSIVPVTSGQDSLGSIRLQAQQRADRVNGKFVSMPEWNNYINQSASELYNILTTLYEDYFKAPDFIFATDGSSDAFYLPDGNSVRDINGTVLAPFYKLLGVDIGQSSGANAWVTMPKYDYIERNRYVFPNVTSTFLGVFNAAYRLMGNKLEFIPRLSAGQQIRVHYVPRLKRLLQDTDILDGINGWTEYVIVDAAIKALQKEESDVSILMAQKQALLDQINSSAMNRDIGQPDTISNTRRSGGWGGPGFDGSFGGY